MSSEATTQAESGAPSSKPTGVRRWKQLVKEHPGTTLAIGAGIAAFAGAEWAFGALLGLGAAMLLTHKTGAEMRDLVRQRLRQLTSFRREPTAPAK